MKATSFYTLHVYLRNYLYNIRVSWLKFRYKFDIDKSALICNNVELDPWDKISIGAETYIGP